MAAAAPGRVEKAVRAELRALDISVQSDGSAALAVALAEQIDHARGAVAAAAAAAQLRMLLEDLAEKAKSRPRRSQVDELRARRGKNRGAAPEAGVGSAGRGGVRR